MASPTVGTPAEPMCPTHLLHDRPAEDDNFGPHRRVARAIADIVRTEPGGRSIGLPGSWGVGKSTVIGLLQRELEQSPDHRVWVFDAWAHSGDPLRRTFLEALIGHLSEQQWLAVKPWKRRLAALARRVKRGEQTTTPLLSAFGVRMAIAVALTPIGLALLNQALRDGLSFPPGNGHVSWTGVFGWALSLGTLLVASVRAARYKIKSWRAAPDTDESTPEWSSILAVFTQRAETVVRTKTIETADPTSIEFAAEFSRAMAEALGPEHPERRLLLVVDNLDRIDAVSALTIWSTLQTFLQPGASAGEWLGRLWILMPFDHTSIAKLWKQEAGVPGTLAESFLDKTFQVRFTVPHPLASDWHKYLASLLTEAMPHHTDPKVHHRIYRLTALRRERGGRHITPREIKVIVNQIGALHRVWQDSIPLTDLAYYVLLQREGIEPADIIERLRARTLLGEEELGLVDEGVRDHLAALAYGVDPHRARQLLLEGPLMELLGTGAATELREAAEGTDGFSVALLQAIDRATLEWPQAEGGKLLSAAAALEESGIASILTPPEVADIDGRIIQAAARMGAMAPISESAERGLVLLARRRRDAAFAGTLFEAYARGQSEALRAGNQVDVHDVAARTLALARALATAGFPNACSAAVELPITLDQFFAELETLEPDGGMSGAAECGVLRPKGTPEQTVNRLQTLVSQGQFRTQHAFAVRVLREWIAASGAGWEGMATVLRERLNGANHGSLSGDEVEALVRTAIDLRDNVQGQDLLEWLTSDGHVASHLWATSNNGNTRTVAMCLLVSLLADPALPMAGNTGQARSGYEIIQAYANAVPDGLARTLADLLDTYDAADLAFALLERDTPLTALAGTVIADLVGRRNRTDILTAERLAAHWSTLEAYVYRAALLAALEQAPAVPELARDAGFDVEQIGLYHALLEARPDDDAFRGWLQQMVSHMDAMSWSAALNGETELLRLAFTLMQAGVSPDGGPQLRDALREHAEQLAEAGHAGPPIVPWADVLGLLHDAQRRTLAEEAFTTLKRHASRVSPAFLSVFGGLIDQFHLVDEAADAPTTIIDPLVRAQNVAGLQWVAAQLRARPQLLANAAPRSLEALRQRLDDELREDGEREDNSRPAELDQILRQLAASVRSPVRGHERESRRDKSA